MEKGWNWVFPSSALAQLNNLPRIPPLPVVSLGHHPCSCDKSIYFCSYKPPCAVHPTLLSQFTSPPDFLPSTHKFINFFPQNSEEFAANLFFPPLSSHILPFATYKTWKRSQEYRNEERHHRYLKQELCSSEALQGIEQLIQWNWCGSESKYY